MNSDKQNADQGAESSKSDGGHDIHGKRFTWKDVVTLGISVVALGVSVRSCDNSRNQSENAFHQSASTEQSMIFNIHKTYEDISDYIFRRRFYRVFTMLNDKNTVAADLLARDLADEENSLCVDTNFFDVGGMHSNLVQLLRSDILLDYPTVDLGTNSERTIAAYQAEFCNYRTVLVRELNTLDALSVAYDLAVKQKSAATNVIVMANIKYRGEHLTNFIAAVCRILPGEHWTNLQGEIHFVLPKKK
jgi:hypothetical protein